MLIIGFFLINLLGCGSEKFAKNYDRVIIEDTWSIGSSGDAMFIQPVQYKGCEYLGIHSGDLFAFTHRGDCPNPFHKGLKDSEQVER